MAQFVLVNVVVAVLMKHLEESHKQVTCRIIARNSTLNDISITEVHEHEHMNIWISDGG